MASDRKDVKEVKEVKREEHKEEKPKTPKQIEGEVVAALIADENTKLGAATVTFGEGFAARESSMLTRENTRPAYERFNALKAKYGLEEKRVDTVLDGLAKMLEAKINDYNQEIKKAAERKDSKEQQYDLTSMPTWLKDAKAMPEKGKFYVEKQSNNLKYSVLTPGGKRVDGVLSPSDFSSTADAKLIDAMKSSNSNINAINPYLSQILSATAKRGHTFKRYKDQLIQEQFEYKVALRALTDSNNESLYKRYKQKQNPHSFIGFDSVLHKGATKNTEVSIDFKNGRLSQETISLRHLLAFYWLAASDEKMTVYSNKVYWDLLDPTEKIKLGFMNPISKDYLIKFLESKQIKNYDVKALNKENYTSTELDQLKIGLNANQLDEIKRAHIKKYHTLTVKELALLKEECHLKKMLPASIYNFINKLVEIRRAHNDDEFDLRSNRKLWEEYDNPSCPQGTQGRIMLGSSIYNELTAFAPADSVRPQIPGQIRDFLIQEIEKATPEIQSALFEYLYNKNIDPDTEFPKTVQAFLDNQLQNVKSKLFPYLENMEGLLIDSSTYDINSKYLGSGATAYPEKTHLSPVLQNSAVTLLNLEVDRIKQEKYTIDPAMMNRLFLACSKSLIQNAKNEEMIKAAIYYHNRMRDIYLQIKTQDRFITSEIIRAKLSPSYLKQQDFIEQDVKETKSMLLDSLMPQLERKPKEAEVKTFLKSTDEKTQEIAGKVSDMGITVNFAKLTEDELIGKMMEGAKTFKDKINDIVEEKRNHPSITRIGVAHKVLDNLDYLYSLSPQARERKENKQVSDESYHLPALLGKNEKYENTPKSWALNFVRLAMEKEEDGKTYMRDEYETDRLINIMKDQYKDSSNKVDEEKIDEMLAHINRTLMQIEKEDKGSRDVEIAKKFLETIFNKNQLSLKTKFVYLEDVEESQLLMNQYSKEDVDRLIASARLKEEEFKKIPPPHVVDRAPEIKKIVAKWVTEAEKLVAPMPVTANQIEKLYDYVSLILFKNLGITKMRREDLEAIKLLCRQYTGMTKLGEDEKLAFEISNKNLMGLGCHIADLINTLKPYKALFDAGFVRIMSSSEYKAKLDPLLKYKPDVDITQFFVFRIASRAPQTLSLTCMVDELNDEGERDLIPENFDLPVDKVIKNPKATTVRELNENFLNALHLYTKDELEKVSEIKEFKPPRFIIFYREEIVESIKQAFEKMKKEAKESKEAKIELKSSSEAAMVTASSIKTVEKIDEKEKTIAQSTASLREGRYRRRGDFKLFDQRVNVTSTVFPKSDDKPQPS